MMDDMVRVFLIVGRPESGILVRLHGETVVSGGLVSVPRDNPAGVVLESLEKLNLKQQVQAQRFPDMPESQLSFEVRERPGN